MPKFNALTCKAIMQALEDNPQYPNPRYFSVHSDRLDSFSNSSSSWISAFKRIICSSFGFLRMNPRFRYLLPSLDTVAVNTLFSIGNCTPKSTSSIIVNSIFSAFAFSSLKFVMEKSVCGSCRKPFYTTIFEKIKKI